MAYNEMPDAEKLKEKITKVLYDAQEGEKFGTAVAKFYKALIDAGMTSEQAFTLSKEYMNNASLGGMLKGVVGGAKRDHE
jgi:hypothetical protein